MTTYIWPEGGGGGGRFAPKYLVGNVPAGDSNVASSVDGFVYIPDPGDGSGIALALTQPDGPGDVWIRPGTYNFGLAGSPVMPLDIKKYTRVQGAGVEETILLGRSSGDQGVFSLAVYASLRDLSIRSPTPTAATNGSIGVVEVTAGGCVINGVSIALDSLDEAAPTIQAAIVIDTAGEMPIPQTSIESVSISVERSTYASGTPTCGIYLIEGQVAARNVTVFGGDIGIRLNNTQEGEDSGACVLFGLQILLLNVLQYGVLVQEATSASNVAAIRMSDSIIVRNSEESFVPPLGVGTDEGVRLEASFVSTFRSVVVFNFTTGFHAFAALAAVRATSVQIDDSAVVLCTLGVRFGPGTRDSSVSDTEIGPAAGPLPITAAQGVYIAATGGGFGAPAGISVTNNTIHVTNWTGASGATFGVWCDADSNNLFIEGNEIQHEADAGNPADIVPSIYVTNSTDVVITDNHIVTNCASAAIFLANSTPPVVSMERCTITGNTITLSNGATQPPWGIDVAAQYVTVTGNVVDMANLALQSPSQGGIIVRGINVGNDPPALLGYCTVTGNTIKPLAQSGMNGIEIRCDYNACSTNQMHTSPIVVSGNNNTVIGNVCGTPVVNTGVGNEVAHNI